MTDQTPTAELPLLHAEFIDSDTMAVTTYAYMHAIVVTGNSTEVRATIRDTRDANNEERGVVSYYKPRLATLRLMRLALLEAQKAAQKANASHDGWHAPTMNDQGE